MKLTFNEEARTGSSNVRNIAWVSRSIVKYTKVGGVRSTTKLIEIGGNISSMEFPFISLAAVEVSDIKATEN